MPEVVAGIALPEGDPGAAFDVAQTLAAASRGFERTRSVTQAAVAAVPSWQGLASLSFRNSCATYEQAGEVATAACDRASTAVRRYGEVFEEGYERVKRLQREAEDCEERLEEAERRVRDASGRGQAARERATDAMLRSPLDGGLSLAQQASAQREAEDAEADRRRAQNEADAAREELERLKMKAEEEHEKIEEAGREAGLAVEDAQRGLPAAEFPSPPAAAGGIPAGGRLKVPDPGESVADRLFGRDYVYPEDAIQVLENGGGAALLRSLGRVLVGGAKAGPRRTRLTPGGGLKAHEGTGRGHTLGKHVGLTDDQLRARLANLPRASTFRDRALAEDAVSGALTANRSGVQYWLKHSSKDVLVIEQEFNREIGRSIARGEAGSQAASKARIVLFRDGSPLGYHVRTAYPVP